MSARVPDDHGLTTTETHTWSIDRALPDAIRPWLGAVMISFSATWVRLADVEPARSAMLRTLYALPVLALLVAWRRRRDGQGRWWAGGAVVAGVLLGIDFVAWHESIAIIGAGLGTVLPNLQVVFVGLAGVLLFRERPALLFWIALPIVLAGIWLLSVVGQPLEPDGSVPLGVVYGIITAITYAGCLVVLRVTRGRTERATGPSMLWCLTLGAAFVTTSAAALDGVAAPAGWPADGWLLTLAIGSQVVGWLLLTSSIHRLPAAATSVALLLQPVLALLWGAVILGEPLGSPQVAGAAVVLVGVALSHRGAQQVVVSADAPAAEPRAGDDVDRPR